MKKYIRLTGIIIAVTCLFMLVSCSLKNNDNKNNDENSVTIRFSWWGGDDRHEATVRAVELFEKKYPLINVETEYGGWDGWTEKVTTQIAGGTAPDVMQINYDWLLRFSNDGKGFYDLEKLSDIIHLENFSDDVLKYGKQNGILNAVPISMTGRSLFFNKTTFDEIGAEIPETWDDLMNLGSIFREHDCYPLDLDIQSGFTAWYLSVVYAQQKFGKEFISQDGILNFTADEIAQALDFYKELENNGVIRTISQRADEDGNDALYQSPEFIDGSVAGTLEWGSAIGKYDNSIKDDDLVTGNLLFLDDCKISGWFIKPSVLYAISSDTDYPEESALLLDFMLNDPQCAEILGTSRGIPASRTAYKALEDNNSLEGLSYQSYQQINDCNPVVISPYMELSEMRNCYNKAIENVSYNIMNTDEAALQMYDEMQQILKKFRD